MNYPILDKAIQELNKEYGTDFQYKTYNGRFWLWDANGVYSSEWYYNNIDYQNEVDPILTKLNEAVVNQFDNDDLFVDYWNFSKMYISGLWIDDEETEEENTDGDHMFLRRDEIIEKYKDKIENLTEDDRHELARRNEVINTSNRNEVSSDNRYTEETRKILEKIGKIAKATADKLGWDEGLVFQDMIRDLQLLGNPALVEQLDPSNPIDQMTKQVLEMQLSGLLGDGNDYELFKTSTLNALMRMDEQQAANQLYQMFNRGQISGGNYQRIENRNQRALPNRRNDEQPVQDSKEDDAKFYEKFGMDNLTRYKRLNQKLEGNNRDITWVTAHIENAEDLNEMLNIAQFGEYTPIAENNQFAVFDITSLKMCQDLARGTTWCITSPTAYNTNARFGARYHFYINKITGEKYCVAMVSGMKEIVDANDNELAKLPEGVPQVGEDEVRSSVVNEDKSSSEALLQTALANVNLLSVDTLRVAYDDMFGEELEMLDDEEVKAWLLEKLPEVDTEELKTYIEEHIDDFAIVPEETDEEEYEIEDYDDDDEEIDLSEDFDLSEVDAEESVEHTKKEIVNALKNDLEKFKLIKIKGIDDEEELTIIKLNFSDEAYDMMSTGTADNFYRKDMNILVFDAETNGNEYFEIVVNRLGNEEDRAWMAKNAQDFTIVQGMADYFSDDEIKSIIEEQNEVYE